MSTRKENLTHLIQNKLNKKTLKIKALPLVLLFSLVSGLMPVPTMKVSQAWASDPLFMDIVDYSASRNRIQVKRVQTTEEAFRNLKNTSLLRIEKVEPDFVRIDGDCLCYYPNDDDFLHLNLLYFGTSYITYMNQFVTSIQGHPLKPISVQLIKDDTNAPRGQAMGDGRVRVWFGTSNFDPSVIVHELTHQIHSELIGRTQDQLEKEIGSRLDPRSHAEFVGIIEGVANFMTALYLGDPIIGRIAWVDIPYSIDASLSYAALPSELAFLERIADSNLFAKRYPVTTQQVRTSISQFGNTVDSTLPDPYLSSPIIFAPLWDYRGHYKKEDYFRLLLGFLASNPRLSSYAEFAGNLVDYLKPRDQAFSDFLRKEYAAHQLVLPSLQGSSSDKPTP